MVYCPLNKWAQLVGLLAVASQYHSFPGRYHQILKPDIGEAGDVWRLLTIERVLGLGFEQILKCLVATEDTRGAFGKGYVVFSNVRCTSASPDGVLGVPISLSDRVFLTNLATDLWRTLDWLGFRVTGIDVPSWDFLSGGGISYSTRSHFSHDVVGVLKPGGLLPQAGPASVEIFLTTLPWESEYVRAKKDKAAANCVAAAAVFCLHILLIIRIKTNPMLGAVELGRRYYRWDRDAASWAQVLHNLVVPGFFRQISNQQRALQDVLDKLGEPFLTGARKISHVFKMATFLQHANCKLRTDRACLALRKKGVKNVKKRALGIGSGGDRGQANGVWTAPLESILEAFPHIWRLEV